MKQIILHQRHEQGTGTRLTINRLGRVKFDVRKPRVLIQALKPFAMRINRIYVKPVVENRFGFQCEGKAIKLEAGEPARFLQTWIALCILRIDKIKVGVRPSLIKHLTSLKRALKLYLAKVLRPDFKMESTQMLAQLLF